MAFLSKRMVINIVLLFNLAYLASVLFSSLMTFNNNNNSPTNEVSSSGLKEILFNRLNSDDDSVNFKQDQPAFDNKAAENVVGIVNFKQDQPAFDNKAAENVVGMKATASANNFEMKNWLDEDQVYAEKLRTGPGEHGKDVTTTAQELKAVPAKFRGIGYNVAASYKISLDRAFPDLADPACRSQEYRKHLPDVTVILPFHNEVNTTLLRTIHSIVNRSPPELLNEIILVDDASTDEELGPPLEKYLKNTFPTVSIHILRVPVKKGLMNARSLGAAHAKGEVLVIFDAHIEVAINFLPPLLQPIAENYKTIATPTVGGVNNDTFVITCNTWSVAGVDTGLQFKYFDPHPRYVARPTEPYPNPVMIGCAFAISKRWWDELEGYDPLLTMWGSEQFEISMKTWMCGGSMVKVPCSRIAHLFRPRKEAVEKSDETSRTNNMHRVALVWMDDGIDDFYLSFPHLLNQDPGDVSQQMLLRKRLNCKSFDWFMHNVQPEIFQKYPVTAERKYDAWGRISSRTNPGLCIRISEYSGVVDFVLVDCLWGDNGLMPERFQYVMYQHLKTTMLKPSRCISFSSNTDGNKELQLSKCASIDIDTNQHWNYSSLEGHIRAMKMGMCLTITDQNSVTLMECTDGNKLQMWDFQYLDPKKSWL